MFEIAFKVQSWQEKLNYLRRKEQITAKSQKKPQKSEGRAVRRVPRLVYILIIVWISAQRSCNKKDAPCREMRLGAGYFLLAPSKIFVSPTNFFLSHKKVFVTKFVICVTKFLTHVTKFVIRVTNFVTNFFCADSEK